jgi:hypothetical protein
MLVQQKQRWARHQRVADRLYLFLAAAHGTHRLPPFGKVRERKLREAISLIRTEHKKLPSRAAFTARDGVAYVKQQPSIRRRARARRIR